MKMSVIKVRCAKESDAEDILNIHYDAVHNLAKFDYKSEILEKWSAPITDNRIKKFLKNPDNETRLVAEIDGNIVGFGALVIELNELRACYVGPGYVRMGVGKALINEIEKIAFDNKIKTLALDSSITAKQFYLDCGYNIVKYDIHILRTGQQMDCIKMKKTITR